MSEPIPDEKLITWLRGLAEAAVTVSGNRATFVSDMHFAAADRIAALAACEAERDELHRLQRPMVDQLKDTTETLLFVAAERDALKAALKPEISAATRAILEEAAEADEAVNDGDIGRAITTLLQWYDQTRAALVKP